MFVVYSGMLDEHILGLERCICMAFGEEEVHRNSGTDLQSIAQALDGVFPNSVDTSIYSYISIYAMKEESRIKLINLSMIFSIEAGFASKNFADQVERGKVEMTRDEKKSTDQPAGPLSNSIRDFSINTT
jgi:hypothetical protein